MYNKAFLLTMENGTQVVAKVPNPNAGLAHFTTASEVATMDFALNVCKTPSPKVLAWSSKASENPVGAEYIIMEKIEGKPLSVYWKSMPIDEKTTIVRTLARYQQAWMSHTFKQYGSLYYSNDVPTSPGQPTFSYLKRINESSSLEIQDKRFAVGPTVCRQTIDYGRAGVNFYRTPWNTLEGYCISIGDREIACVKAVDPIPKPFVTLAGRYIPTREKKLAALEAYLKLIKFLLPTDSTITTSHIWHSDLHLENIFVNPDDPTEIVGILDWQSSSLSPLYENSASPALLDYEGPRLKGIERPEFPKHLDELDKAEHDRAFDNWMDMTLAAYYRTLIHYTNKPLYRAMEFQETLSFRLLTYARNILIDGELVYLDIVTDELQKTWATLPGVQKLGNPPFPFTFSQEELDAHKKDYEDMAEGMKGLSEIQQCMRGFFPTDITVAHEDYEMARQTARECKEKVLESFARNEVEREAVRVWWPYD
ncbi:Protein kinase-like (PK-like) [Glarea lozoyensis ATCC 20868]|uniref:Altered inheritance of mitochondria protein 9, mitochondrial n=1 Tax=Glarea lozoyensis (strain ATCC 20868 / MF5171) TaxID=1116229 RepID=S3DZI2_GLAL2|nr:Protein kinase-like (PK-like) [Glarea lozoyensis ATCC 20868]EPE31723.1 Protein kinase-like (PK-like) [Glarea lozoyensis ATCC 20868]